MHGVESAAKYEHRFPGHNFRMEGLQGALLAVKLLHLDQWNEQRRNVAKHYDLSLSGSELITPTELAYANHVYHLYVIQADDREVLRKQLAGQGIETGLHYPIPLHLQEAYRSLGYRPGDFPVCERLAQRILSLPMYPELTEEAVEHVASAVLESLQCAMTEVSETARQA